MAPPSSTISHCIRTRVYFIFDGGRHGRLRLIHLPQRASQSPALATAFLQSLLQLVSHIGLSYANNIVIKRTGDETWSYENVRQVLDLLEDAEVTLNLKPTWCGTTGVPVLSTLWSAGGIRPADERIADILALPTPSILSNLRSAAAMVR
ncbi:hypothetical protein K437DRAFT_90929 [Tilletiaria anomala UBC 951]|uniref:Uncharacterized protein n=1 Tax=Tilletiaria anomala (strain ATCC 24038 / CBS 436.72 / UBC 951) TaxID=1037660 RepID=A0A066W2Q2_TILAU|nr:uncharacterized protein K437DRAFT_90929 [Tilletiaria anomala UBC 951]KDN48001.1 hypothetical protein K437DRAFT_90929 [Tilletiaria anomala UBC 951]